MTEYEVNDLIISIQSTIGDLTAIYISVFVAFIVCVYLVGSKLSKFQSFSLSCIYSLFAFFLIFMHERSITRIGALISDSTGRETDLTIQMMGPAILGIAWLASMIYMVQVRRDGMSKLSDGSA